MSVLTRHRLTGSTARITRPVAVRHADGSQSRTGAVNGVSPEPEVLQAEAPVRIASLTTERREHVFGATAKATETIRVPLQWGLIDGDQLEMLSGPDTGRRFRVEKVIAYRTRPRLTHAECALVALPAGAR
jgi:hypothetical protein